ncbi:hypothetical protein JMJ35_004323 [Cladonia borealis]|uniref:Type I phosphodiesterase/nucleotide pyrophosphatase n=1 Tax=Cladonia borealis TaxID=184061 RepID=A0AA39R1S9_9LECA|nr:hypothetical protein JMJ35_004323 [Cladonia borealis]
MLLKNFIVGAVFCAATNALPWNDGDDKENEKKSYKYVALFSVDGFHSSGVAKYSSLRPQSNIAALLATGYEYANAFTSAPSDSFPGTMNQYTGASPRTTGTRCQGKSGAEVALAANLDYNSTERFSGGINPDELPQKLVNGQCTLVYPHNRTRINTIFEVVHQADKHTAYADKHPAYDLVRGPSGEGLTVGYFPKIAAVANTVDATITCNSLHVTAFFNWISGTTPPNSEKTAGYTNDTKLTFTAPLLKAFDFVNNSLSKIVDALKAKNIYDQTLIIVASKHGQAPINPALYHKIDLALIIPATGVDVDWVTTNNIAPLFLTDQSTLAKALGVIYTTSTAKIAEYGGLSDDDRKVACFASAKGLKKLVINDTVSTKQIGPTVLKVLGLNPEDMQGAKAEGTKALKGF